MFIMCTHRGIMHALLERSTSNVNSLLPILTNLNLKQRSHYSTHILGGTLDLVLDSLTEEPVAWCPTPFSDHFQLFFD